MIRPNLAGAAELELQRGKITIEQYLSLLDKRSFCDRDSTLAAIRSHVELNRRLRKLREAIAQKPLSPEHLCLKAKLTSQSELEEIRDYRLRSADCHLGRKDLAPLVADHQDTVRLMKRVCSPAFLGGPLPDILRFDEYKMPPFPE